MAGLAPASASNRIKKPPGVRTIADLPKFCRAAVVKNPGINYTLAFRDDYPVPAVERDCILVRLQCTGLCMSDTHFLKGDWGVAMNDCDCTGHEGAGYVVAIGEDVQEAEWKLGDLAGVQPLFDSCKNCRFCRSGNETVCGYGAYTGLNVNGSYCEYVNFPARHAPKLPKNLPLEICGPLMCSGSTAYAALMRVSAKAGEFVCVLGAGGGIGHMVTTYAKALGFRPIAIDTGDAKRKLCMELGAELFIDFKEETNPVERVHEYTDGGARADAVIVAGANKQAFEGATSYLARLGTLVSVGLPAAGTTFVGCDPLTLSIRKLNIRGSVTGNLDEIKETLDLAARKQAKPFVTVYPWKDFASVHAKLLKSEIVGRSCISFRNEREAHRVLW